MIRYTQKQIKNLISTGAAVDITRADANDRKNILTNEYELTAIGYSIGKYGRNGLLLISEYSGTLYAIGSRSTALFIFG